MTNEPAHESALITLGRINIADVPDMGYARWNKAVRARNEKEEFRDLMLFCSPVLGALGAGLAYLAINMPGPISILSHLYLWMHVAICAIPTFLLGYTQRLLNKAPDPAQLLPPSSSPELAAREHQLIKRIEAHNRNIRLLRGMPVIDPKALETAMNEERDLRDGTLALAEAQSDIASLLTD